MSQTPPVSDTIRWEWNGVELGQRNGQDSDLDLAQNKVRLVSSFPRGKIYLIKQTSPERGIASAKLAETQVQGLVNGESIVSHWLRVAG